MSKDYPKRIVDYKLEENRFLLVLYNLLISLLNASVTPSPVFADVR